MNELPNATDPLVGAIEDLPGGAADVTEGARAARDADDYVVDTGTTTVGVAVDDGAVVATDKRASLGGRFVASKDVTKVEQVHPRGVLTLVGSVGGAQSFFRTLRAESNLDEARTGAPMSHHALATFAGSLARGGPFRAINPILAGVDDEGSHVYSIDPAGGVMEDDYTVTGSGMQLAHGALEGGYAAEHSLAEASQLAARAITAATERDTGSGNGMTVAVVDDEGVEIEEYEHATDLLE
jgi:proteasome beta subunit